MPSQAVAYVLLALGVIIILFTFYLSYGLYESISGSSSITPAAPVAAGGSNLTAGITSAISGLTQNLGSTTRGVLYAVVEIIILFLFANIGYKIAHLGISIMRSEGKGKDNASKQK